MKCVRTAGGVARLPNDEAEALVESGAAHYVPKATWKSAAKNSNKHSRHRKKHPSRRPYNPVIDTSLNIERQR